MMERGLLPDFSPEALAELKDISTPATEAQVRDLSISYGLPLTTMTPVIWTSLQLQRRCLKTP